MRIFYLSDSPVPSPTADSVHVMKMCNAFAQSGHNVTLFCYSNDQSPADTFGHYGLVPTFRLEPIPNVHIPGLRRLQRVWFQFRRSSTERLPELYYGRDAFGLAAISGRGVPMIFEAHTLPRSRAESAILGRVFRSPRLIRLVAITEALREDYLKAFPTLALERTVVAHDAADVSRTGVHTEVVSSEVGREGVVQVGYVGSALKGKGTETVISLAKARPEYDFHIVGGTESQVHEMESAAGKVSNLFLHGRVAHSLVPAYLQSFDVVLFPGQRSVILKDGTDIGRWTSPMKIFEYMAAGKAIIASDTPVVREILKVDEEAILVDPLDIEGWSRAIDRLAKSKDLRCQIGDRARERCLAHYTWSRRAQIVLAEQQ